MTRERTTRPTDLELMMFYDGELDEPRRREVEAFLAVSSEGQLAAEGKLLGLAGVGRVLREDIVTAPRFQVDLTSAIMAGVERERAKESSSQASSAIEKAQPKKSVEPKKSAENGDAKAELGRKSKVVPLTSPESESARPAAANDNGRFILGLAGVAAAAAAALFFWGRAPESGPVAQSTAADTAEVATAASPKPAVTVAEKAAPLKNPVAAVLEDERPPPVEVASVDFGKRTGAIYYMAGDTKETQGETTTVVWVADE